MALWHIRRRRARRSSTPSGSISLITILIVSWETTYPLRLARRCNHRYPWSRPLVAISDCTKEAISSMSVWFFLLNKLSFLHNRCSVLLLIITPCWCSTSIVSSNSVIFLKILGVYSRITTSLFSKYYDFILLVFRLYSRSVSTLFSKCFDFILEVFRLYSRSVSTLFSKCFDFILEVFRLYSRSVSTLFSKCFDFILVTFRLFFS